MVINAVQLGIKSPVGLGLMIFCYALTQKLKRLGTILSAIGIVSYELYSICDYDLKAVPVSMVGIVFFKIITAV